MRETDFDDVGSIISEQNILKTLTDVEVEACIIGQIIVHDAWQLYSSLGISPDDFWRGEHRKIIIAAAKAFDKGQSPDPVLIREYGGDAVTIDNCMNGTVKVRDDNAKWMLTKLKELTRARSIYYASQNLEVALGQGELSAQEIVTDHLKSIDEIVQDSTDAGVVMDASAQFTSLTNLAKQRGTQRRVWLGLLALDRVIDGLSPGEILGLASRPGVGKTLWMGRYIQAVMEYDIPALMFSLEMPTAQIVTRLLQPEYQWSRTKALEVMESGELSVEKYKEKFSKLHICDRAGLSVAEMEAITKRIKKQHDIGLVLIDHLGLVGGHRNLRPYERVSTNSQQIKDLAKRCDVSVVLAMQVSREAGGDGSIPLTLSSTRDSGVTEEVVDYLVGLHRPERNANLGIDQQMKYEDIVMARVLKNRHGAVGEEVAVHINSETLEWTERPNLRHPTSRRRSFDD
jgi:replicative DNA helicase